MRYVAWNSTVLLLTTNTESAMRAQQPNIDVLGATKYMPIKTLYTNIKKIHQFINPEFETIEMNQTGWKTIHTTSTSKLKYRPGTRKWLQKPQPKVTTDEQFNIPESISPIYEPSRLSDSNTTFIQGEVGQFNLENEQIINICSIYNTFPRNKYFLYPCTTKLYGGYTARPSGHPSVFPCPSNN